MSIVVDSIDRCSPGQRPNGRCAGYQTWSDLLFVHWRVCAESLQRLVPPGVTIDTFDGDAWVGLVPFHMSRVRPWWFPATPGISEFHETNVRTYVHHRGREPGVWFFSLDASNAVPVKVARALWKLNYFHAAMRIDKQGSTIRYSSSRRRTEPIASLQLEADVPALGLARDDGQKTTLAVPGTLEHFLVERYLLYTQSRSGELLQGRVHHRPYPLNVARVVHLEESLLVAAGIQVDCPPCHAIFSTGVHVEIFPLRRVE